MEFSGDYRIAAPQWDVWNGLNDPEVLRVSLPGCQLMERTGANEFTATIVTRIGPIAATFKGKVELSDLDPPARYVLSGQGQGGPAGFAKGHARIDLEPVGEETLLRYTAEVDVGGKLASLGGRLIGGVAKTMADEFFKKFSNAITAGQPKPDSAETPPDGTTRPLPDARLRGHIPLIDRVGWLIAGFGLGVIAALYFTARI